MGLLLTLPKEKNALYYDFEDAYWAIDNVFYSCDRIDFFLHAYPSRESKKKNYSILENPSFGYGSANGAGSVSSDLYTWHVTMSLTKVFKDGSIPAGKDAQYTAIYNWIKWYTELPWKDVFEEDTEEEN